MKSDKWVAITGDIDDGNAETAEVISSYLSVLERRDIKGTFPITSMALRMFPERLCQISERGHEIAGHGDIHEKFLGDRSTQALRLSNMVTEISDVAGVEVYGFRAPWYICNKNTFAALSDVGLSYDSSLKKFEIMYKAPIVRKRYRDSKALPLLRPFLRLAAITYNVTLGRRSVPYKIHDNVMEIPVLGISDYSMISDPKGPQLSESRAKEIGDIWIEAFSLMKEGVLVIQAHPKRLKKGYLQALEHFIDTVSAQGAKFITLREAANLTEVKN